MSVPIPAPRNLPNNNEQTKRPIPAPRQLVPIRPTRNKHREQKVAVENKNESINENKNVVQCETKQDVNSNTFTRRVRTLSNASKQIAEDIGEKVHEGKKAVIEGTRSSVRKITKRFHVLPDSQVEKEDKENENESDIPINIFSSIRFNSPINTNQAHAYVNVNPDFSVKHEFDDYNTPPPPYPPPPLRGESVYDEPQSVVSGSTNSSNGSENVFLESSSNYESVFPSYPYNSDTDSCIDLTAGTLDRNIRINRSDSWSFYDQVPRTEQIYSNIDSTPSLSPSVIVESNDEIYDMKENSIYENHDIQIRDKAENCTKKPTESVMLQFDPLKQSLNETNVEIKQTSNVHELIQLEQLLQGDLYSNLSESFTADNWSISNESEPENYVNPPPPPARFDSLPEEPSPVLPRRESKTNWYTNVVNNNNNNEHSTSSNNTTNSKSGSSGAIGLNLFKQMNEVLKKAPNFVKGRNKEIFLQRPALISNGLHQHKGMLYKVTTGPVEDFFGEFNSRWCTLEGHSFLCHQDHTCNTVKENFSLDSVLSIQLLQDQKYKYKYENDDVHCFELNTSGKSRGGYVYGSRSISERRVWMQKLAEGLTGTRFGAKLTSDYSRIGWTYLREGVSGHWIGAWLILARRNLYYAVDNCSVKTVDLRKTRCVTLQPLTENDQSPKTTDRGPNLLLDCQNGGLYMRMWTARETKVWCHIAKLAAHNNGANLDQQQLTKNDIPVIVERCINFIYVYGSMSEGIYRRSGSSMSISDILTQFRQDAWSAQLTKEKYTEHDVATALKRFFRDLPEPLLTNSKRQYFCQVSLVRNRDEKIRMYKAVFDSFAPIVYNTIRKLIGHLHFITSQSDKNRMTVDNLASVWGPTLMHSEDDSNPHQDSMVISELINLYTHVFPENQVELEREVVMLKVLKKYSNLPHGRLNSVKSSGDFRVWVYLNNKQGETYNIAIGPQKTAYEVCLELSSKIDLPVHEILLEELVLNDNLVRPVHHTEKVLDVVLKWGYWDENDRKDNCLILTPIKKYNSYILDNTIPLSGDLKFADNKTKNFRSFNFEFSHAKLSYSKDKSGLQVLGSWNIEDVIWYLGCEPKRNPPTKYVLTFFKRNEKPIRSKAFPWFGNVLAWNDQALKVTWIGSMWKSAHPHDIMPPAQHVNVLN